MKTEHTPGPWYIEENSFVVKKHAGQIITITAALDGRIDNIERAANAKLIAAAPELLEACKLALWVMEKNEAQGMDYGVEKIQLQNAITKATNAQTPCVKCDGNGMVNEPNKPEKHDCEFCEGTGSTNAH